MLLFGVIFQRAAAYHMCECYSTESQLFMNFVESKGLFA